eukprot:167977_1
MDIVVPIIMTLLLTPFVALIFGPLTFTMIIFMDQLLNWNIFPLCLDFGTIRLYKWMSKGCNKAEIYSNIDETKRNACWYQYRLYKWIKNGCNREERDNRLCCVNMVILDKYYENNYVESLYFGKKSVELFGNSKHPKYNFNFAASNRIV